MSTLATQLPTLAVDHDQTAAVAHLRRLGWPNARIARALRVDVRTVQRRIRLLKQLSTRYPGDVSR